MFRKNSRNSFLSKTCKQLPRSTLDKSMDEVFFNCLKLTEDQQVTGLREFKGVEDSFQVGHKSVGFEILIDNILSDDSFLVAESLNQLCNELKNPIKVVQALKSDILDILTMLLSDLKNYIHPSIMQNSLQLLHLLSENYDASMKIASNKTLTDVVINMMFDKELSLLAANILISLSSNTNVADKLLGFEYFVQQVKLLASRSKPVDEIYESVSSFIARKPEMFATTEIFKALHQHVLNCSETGSIMKCIALIIGCDEGLKLANENEFLTTLTSILMQDARNEKVLTSAIIALKNVMIKITNIQKDFMVPWKELTKLLVQNSFSKENKLLQEASLQTLRFISDRPAVKEELQKVYKIKIRQITCLSEDAEKHKEDLLQWLKYRNYKPGKSLKYSKLFI